MTCYAMPWGYKLVTSLAMAMLLGCSANGGSTAATGAGGSAGNSGTTTGGSGANGGAGGNVSNVYQSVSASNQANLYTLQMGPIKMVIDASVGARITEFSYDGTNVLTGPEVDTNTIAPAHNNYGSTFWTSPQSTWGWPPVTAIDSLPYTGSVDSTNNTIQLVGQAATIAGAQLTLTKKFVAVANSGAIDVVYSLANAASSVSFSAAPWQISRVAGSGSLTFFGKGTGTYTNTGTLSLTEQDGIYWYSFLAAGDSKAKSDGLGWIAHATASNLLLLFSYPDVQPNEVATNEAEVEIYTGPHGDYVEIEPQGAYQTIAPGSSLEWTVRWKLRQIPSGTAVAVGSTDLATFAEQQLSQ
jgi:hypothetical protein